MNKKVPPLTSKTIEKMRISYFPNSISYYNSGSELFQSKKNTNKRDRSLGKAFNSSSISNLYPASNLYSSFNDNSSLSLKYVNETLFKLYEPIQRLNRLKLKMAKENNGKKDSEITREDKNRLALIDLKFNNPFQPTNTFKPKRSIKKQINNNKEVLSSDWSRKSLFELPDADEFFVSQQKKQVELLLSKFDPERLLKDQLSQSNVLISSLLENPKVDHKKLFYYLKSPQKYLPPPVKMEVNKYLSPIQINNQKTNIVRPSYISTPNSSTSNLSNAELNVNLEL